MFHDRRDAGRRLAAELEGVSEQALVLAIPRGGVVVGAEVGRRLGLEVSLVIPRKIGAPGSPELAIGAVVGQDVSLDQRLVSALGVSKEYIEAEVARERREIERRRSRYLGKGGEPDVSGRDVIIVDDGLATGLTAQAAGRGVASGRPRSVVLAVPVAPADTLRRLEPDFDKLVCLETPSPFYAVGQFYSDFDQVSDEQVIEIMNGLGKS